MARGWAICHRASQGGTMTAATKGAKRRSAEERIAALQKRESQLKARRQALEARARQQERKRRTRQLIQLGGVLAAWGFDTPEQVEGLLREVTVSAARRVGGAPYRALAGGGLAAVGVTCASAVEATIAGEGWWHRRLVR